ncbi:MAG: hypothetical protein U0T77_11505 [Chitinophagales bacterium]
MSQTMKSSIFYLMIDLLLILVLVYQTNNKLRSPSHNKMSEVYYYAGTGPTVEDTASVENYQTGK